MAGGDRVPVEVDGHRMALGHLDKRWFPDGTTKGEALAYYTRVAPVLLPLLAGRAATFVRAPDGVEGQRWVAKHVPPGAPEWLSTVEVPRRSGTFVQIEVDGPAALVWAVNAGCIEFHVPQWRRGGAGHDRIVFDLDPGPGAGLASCCRVALLLRERLAADGLPGLRPVVSGSKGLHLYAALEPAADEEEVVGYAHAAAGALAADRPRLATDRMAKSERTGRVFVDWSQNRGAKTTCCPYSLRARDVPSVAAPVGWQEVERGAGGGADGSLRFGPDEVLERVEEHGDPLADAEPGRLPGG